MRFGFFLLIITLVILTGVTFVLAQYAQGYRLVFNKNIFTKEPLRLTQTGLLAATSTPDGASIYINDHLTSATNTTIDLTPGDYSVKIVKEGYLAWEKKLTIQKETVTQTQALLFPAALKLEALTTTGVLNPVADPSSSSIAYGVASSSSAKKNGVFVLDMSSRPILTLRNASLRIADDNEDKMSSGQFAWSPNGKELLVQTATKTTYHIQTTEFNNNPQDITATVSFTKDQWEREKADVEKTRLDSLKPKLADFIRINMKVYAWSADETKILYEASQGATLNTMIDQPLIGSNSQKEERDIKKGRIYVYDSREDKNFYIKAVDPASPSPVWFPDSRHIVYIEDKEIKIMEYDGTNNTAIYSGPFEENFVYPWPDGSRLVILTSYNSQSGVASNLYTIDLK